jgi:hypothetical protein
VACLLLIRLCLLLPHFCGWSNSVRCSYMSVLDPILLLFRHVCCCSISCNRVNFGVIVSNPTPMDHPMVDRLDSKSWQRFCIMEVGRYIILIGSQFVVTCRLFVSVWVTCLLVVCCNMNDMSVGCLFQFE